MTKQGMWVRNFNKSMVPYIDANKTVSEKDHFLLLKNEHTNNQAKYAWIDTEDLYHDKILIVSNGYGFDSEAIMNKLPSDVAVIGVHGSLAKWKSPRTMNYYVVNNPYQECMSYLPRRNKSLPRCIASTRTNPEFLDAYRGSKYRYVPVGEDGYNGTDSKEIEYQIDDYRNPICAAINLAYKFGVERLALCCCDDAFEGERVGAEKLHNGLWIYPPQRIAHGLIDGSLYWLRHGRQEIFTADCSSGPLYENAEYIDQDKLQSFFDGVIDDKKE